MASKKLETKKTRSGKSFAGSQGLGTNVRRPMYSKTSLSVVVLSFSITKLTTYNSAVIGMKTSQIFLYKNSTVDSIFY